MARKKETYLYEDIVNTSSLESDSDIFDQISDTEEKMGENQDLYKAFLNINKVLEAPSRYNEIQTIAPAIDVNKGIITIDGVTKHDVKADAQDLNRVEDKNGQTESAYVVNIIEEFADDLANNIPDNLEVEYELLDDELEKMYKRRFKIIIKRKG